MGFKGGVSASGHLDELKVNKMKNVPENAVAWLNDTNKEIYATKESLFVDGVEFKPCNKGIVEPVQLVINASGADMPECWITDTILLGKYIKV